MKSFFSLLFILFYNISLADAQSLTQNDTLYIIRDKFKYINDVGFNTHNSLLKNDQKHYYLIENGRSNALDTVISGLFYNGPYVIVLDNKGRKIEEGNWGLETLENGNYTSYYSNGNIKSKGKLDSGRKVGLWKYYTKKGKLKEEMTY